MGSIVIRAIFFSNVFKSQNFKKQKTNKFQMITNNNQIKPGKRLFGNLNFVFLFDIYDLSFVIFQFFAIKTIFTFDFVSSGSFHFW
ncbi:MAG: hypothetical protein D8M58_15880 [Calditrichaeota bacterium]|nr:MAG: hypothetical protein DWQ03_07610 [Calditrichota bacterium]MBL1206884.1 hypothetical protein [Calditrichota bacterium]